MIRVQLLASWTSSRELCELYNRMTTDGAYEWHFTGLSGSPETLRITWDDDDPDWWVVINRPPHGFDESRLDPDRTVVFHMEPEMWTARMRPIWGDWAAPSPRVFRQVRDHRRYRNVCDWWVGQTYRELRDGPSPEKTRLLSAVVSAKYTDPGHIKRIDFLRFLDGTNLDLDIYGSEENGFRHGRGPTPLHDKRAALLPYKYAFNAENHASPNFFTEKIVDCVLAEALCFYWGCPNLDSFLDPRVFIRLDLDDFEADLARIKRAIDEDEWEQRLPAIRAEKARILEHWQFFPTLARVIDPARRRRRWHAGELASSSIDRWVDGGRAQPFVEVSDRAPTDEAGETVDVERRLDWTGLCIERDPARALEIRPTRDCIVAIDDGKAIDRILEHNGIAPRAVEWLNLAVREPAALLTGALPRLDMTRVRANVITLPRASADERARCAVLLAPHGYEVTDDDAVLVRRGRDEIVGFYHLCTLNGWRAIVAEQLERWARSGLLDATGEVHATIVGPEAEAGRTVLADALGDRLVVVECSTDASRFERPILEHAREWCAGEGALARGVWYMHAKGVSSRHVGNEAITDWRRYLGHFVVERWEECVAALDVDDVCGVSWRTTPRPHFSGNFWWAAPRYVARLPDEIGHAPFDPEAWIGSDRPRVRSLHESGINHYVERYPARRYRDDATERPTICLNMIVRDEAHVVEEVLVDAAPHIDTWVIVDTGSTDGTPDVIRSFFAARGIPGELHERPWRDFGTNRTEALELSAGRADYIWVIDADDRVVGDLDLTGLTADSYLLRYGSDFTYWRKQIFRDGLAWRYEGTVHEYPTCAEPCDERRLDGDYHIESRRLGARNLVRDKYRRDADLLRAALEERPDDARSAFYLAQSLRDLGDLDEALEWYERRVELAGWDEETFVARLERARLLERKGDWTAAVAAYLEAWESRPTRAEPLYELARGWRTRGAHALGHLFASRASSIEPPDDLLFVAADVHRWRALDEQAISAYYVGRHQESFDLCTQLLARTDVPEADRERILANRDFAAKVLLEQQRPVYDEAAVARLNERVRGTSGATEPDVTLTVTTCRRRELFERTIDSFLATCTDLDRIGRFVCIDDGSSDDDRARMQERYPFFEFIWKDRSQAGHARSMNMLRDTVTTPYWLHLEDDWEFFAPGPYVTRALTILDSDPQLGQVLFNRNYGETLGCRTIVGGEPAWTADGTRYRRHMHLRRDTDEGERHIASLGPGKLSNAWWPHFSLRPSMMRTATVHALGPFDERAQHFELDFATRYTAAGRASAFFDEITCVHIGRTTFERGKTSTPNAYDLNAQPQFGELRTSDELTIRVINLDRRPDRWERFLAEAAERAGAAFAAACTRNPGVDGSRLTMTPELEKLFRDNDFGSRRGFIGCALAHLEVWRAVVADDTPALVFEDDAHLRDGFVADLVETRHWLASGPWAFHVVLLGHHRFVPPVEVGEPRLERIDTDNYFGGLYGYLISPEGARRLLSIAARDGVRHGIDRFVQRCVPEVEVLWRVPPIVDSEVAAHGSGLDSDIQHDLTPVASPDGAE